MPQHGAKHVEAKDGQAIPQKAGTHFYIYIYIPYCFYLLLLIVGGEQLTPTVNPKCDLAYVTEVES